VGNKAKKVIIYTSGEYQVMRVFSRKLPTLATKSFTAATLIFAREIESKLGESTGLGEVMKIEQRVYFAGWPAGGVESFA